MHGDALYQRPTLEERFWSKVAVGAPDECWPWTGYCDKGGYGIFTVASRRCDKAHRVAYRLKKGEPGTMDVRHKCDNPPCCNPDHLQLGSHAENMKDRFQRGRYDHQRHAAHKLTPALVRAIRARHAEGAITHQVIATEFGISRIMAGMVIRRQAWADVE